MSSEPEMRMQVGGMTCEHCEEVVARALAGAGARVLRVDSRRGEALFENPGRIDVSVLAEAVRAAGYQPGPIEALESAGGDKVRSSSGSRI